MPKVNLNAIRTGNRTADKAISRAQNIISNPAAAAPILSGVVQDVIDTISSGQIPNATTLSPKIVNPAIKSQLASLYTNTETPSSFLFPNDLDEDHYMLFKVMESRRLRKEDDTKIKAKRTIALPIPGNLQVSYAADYENASLGVLGGLIGGNVSLGEIGSGLSSALDDITNFGKGVISDAKKGKANDATVGVGAGLLGTAAAVKIGGAVATGILGGDVIGGAIKGLSKRTGLAMNPHMAVVFNGVGFKEHSFNFKFVARNEYESRQIQAICKIFRHHMLPSYAYDKLAFNYPDEFEIEFSTTVAPFLYNIGTCVLKSFNVSYNGQGVPQFYANTQAPIEVDIQLGFQEVHIETRATKHGSGFGSGGDALLPDLWDFDHSAQSDGDRNMHLTE